MIDYLWGHYCKLNGKREQTWRQASKVSPATRNSEQKWHWKKEKTWWMSVTNQAPSRFRYRLKFSDLHWRLRHKERSLNRIVLWHSLTKFYFSPMLPVCLVVYVYAKGIRRLRFKGTVPRCVCPRTKFVRNIPEYMFIMLKTIGNYFYILRSLEKNRIHSSVSSLEWVTNSWLKFKSMSEFHWND